MCLIWVELSCSSFNVIYFFVVVVTKYKRRGGLALVVMLFDYAAPFCFSVVVIVFALTLHQSIYYCLLIYNVQLSQFNVYYLFLGLFVFSFHCICLYQSTFLLQIFFLNIKRAARPVWLKLSGQYWLVIMSGLCHHR